MVSPLSRLHQFIVAHHDLEEFKTLCFDLGVNYDDLRGEALSGKIRELILRLGRERQLDRLLTALARARPGLSGETILKTDSAALEALYAALPSFEDTRLPAPPAPGESPFKGLRHFDQADAHLFFGRETLTAQLVGRLGEDQFLAVVGASGSGKSSVVRAGLIPTLRRGEPLVGGTLPPDGSATWPVHVITPTRRPLEALAASLTRDAESVTATTTLMDDLARDPRALHLYVRKILGGGDREGQPHGDRLLLVVDQFEELFTLCRDEAQRQAFVDSLMAAVAPETDGPTVLIIALRADFYAHCAQYEALRAALARRQEFIGPMNHDELRRAIEEPAKHNDWEFEPGLVDLLLRDVGDEPGALPLLSHALLETWKRRQGRALTLAGYHEAGGVNGAIAKTAETVFRQRLKPEQQPIARNIFLRLTELGEGTQDTRRPAALAELIPRSTDAPRVEAVLKTLADARLVTTDEESVEVAHEALIREWPTLRRWLDEDRESLRLHRQLGEAAKDWAALDRDPGALYRGARWEQADEWATEHAEQLNALEREFLEASRAAQAEQVARERRAVRFRFGALGAIGLLIVGALILGMWSLQRDAASQRRLTRQQQEAAGTAAALAADEAQARQVAETRQMEAIAARETAQARQVEADDARATAEAERDRAEGQTSLALSRQLAAQAINLLNDDQYEAALLLAIEAGRTLDTAEAFAALRQAFAHPGRTLVILAGHTDGVNRAEWNADESRILTASADGTARVWDARTGEELLALTGHTASVNLAKWSVDESRIMTASNDGTARVWDAQTGEELLTLKGHTPVFDRAEWDADGSRILTANLDTVKVWDAQTGEELLTLSGLPYGTTAVWDADGSRILTGGDGVATVKAWDAQTGEELFAFVGPMSQVIQLGWNADQSRILAAGYGPVTVWDTQTGEQLFTLAGHADLIWQARWNADESRILTASHDHTAKVWDAETGEELLTLAGHGDSVYQAEWNADGNRILTASWDGTAKVWDAQTGAELVTLSDHTTVVNGAVWDAGGSRILTASADGTARVWDVSAALNTGVATGAELFILTGHAISVYQAEWNADESRILTAGWDGTARVWDAQTGEELLTLEGHAQAVRQARWNADESRILTASDDRTARVWDAQTGEELLTLAGHTRAVQHAEWSADEGRILTAGHDGVAKVWDAKTGEELFTLFDHADIVNRAEWNADGSRILTASDDGTAKVWDGKTGEELLILGGHTQAVRQARWNADESRVLTASDDGTARMWDAQTGEELLTLSGHAVGVYQAEWNADESRILTAGCDAGDLRPFDKKCLDGTARVWDAQTGEELLTFAGHTQAVRQARWNADESRILTASDDGTARVWDARTGDELFALFGRAGIVYQAEWNADESRILTAGANPIVRLWYTRMSDLRNKACQRAPRNMTQGEWRRYLGDEGYVETCPGKLVPGRDF